MFPLTIVGVTDVGLRRSHNEDAYVVLPARGVAAVADGMGGQAAGEVASAIFVDTVRERFEDSSARGGKATSALVADAFSFANERILRFSEEDPRTRGMGCTAELLVFDGDRYVLGHVGDSRAYLYRKGGLRQVTKDHSLVQEQVDRGLLSPSDARIHPMKNVILRAVGVEEALEVDLLQGECAAGDIYLLCSDGLSDMTDDGAIADTLGSPLSLSRKADRLLELAKRGGGLDNITVILCEVSPP